MITLMLSAAANFQVGQVIGVILSIAEVIFVIARILACFIDPKTKLGKIVHKIALSKDRFKRLREEIIEETREEDKDGINQS